MSTLHFMDRRALMRNTALLLGAATVPTLAGCKAALSGTGALDDAQIKVLTALADTIIPATDTPGAVGVKVPEMISGMIRDWASQDTKTLLTAALDAVGKLGGGTGFADLDPAQRKAALVEYDRAAVQPGPPPKEKPTGLAALMGSAPMANPGYVRLKELVINLYYASEVASTRELVYEHVPGKFVPSLKVTPETRPFAGVGGLG